MTYQLYHGITMVQVDAGDSIFYVDPAFLFFRDGKEIPTSEAINGLKATDVCENFTFGGYTLTMIWVDGAVSFDNFPTLGSIACHLWFLDAADNATPPPDLLPVYDEWYRGYFEYPYCDYNMTIAAEAALEAARARQEHAEAAPAATVTDDTTPAMDATTEPFVPSEPSPAPEAPTEAQEATAEPSSPSADSEPATAPEVPTEAAEPAEPLTKEEAAAAAGIFLEPVEGATEILVCCGEFLESTKTPIMTITWLERATEFNLAHILFRAWTMIDENDPCGYMRACDRVKDYYSKYYPRDDFNRMTLDILHKRYPNGEADIKDEFDERTVASMRRLEARFLTAEAKESPSEPSSPASDSLPAPDPEPAAEATTTPVDEPYLYANIPFCSFIINSKGERLQIDDINAAMKWAEEHPEAHFGDLSVAAWRFTSHEPTGYFEHWLIVVNWQGEDLWFLQTDEKLFNRHLGELRAMGHALHPMAKDKRVFPTIENSHDWVDITDGYIHEESGGPDNTLIYRTAKRILSSAKRVIRLCNKSVSLQASGRPDSADEEFRLASQAAKAMQFDAVGWMSLEDWDAINSLAAAATDGHGDPRYWGYIAGEYVKWANKCLFSTPS